jgi:hypothetical protein
VTHWSDSSNAVVVLPVCLLADERVRKQEDDAHARVEHDARHARQRPEKPIVHVRLLVRGKVELGGETLEVLEGLRGHVVKVDEVTHRMQDGEEEGGAGANLMRRNHSCPKYCSYYSSVLLGTRPYFVKLYVRVGGNVLVQRGLLEFCKQVL